MKQVYLSKKEKNYFHFLESKIISEQKTGIESVWFFKIVSLVRFLKFEQETLMASKIISGGPQSQSIFIINGKIAF